MWQNNFKGKQSMKVGHILNKKGDDNVSISKDESLIKAAAIMSERHIGSLIILDSGKPLSIVTERDIMLAVTRFGADFSTAKVSEVMAADLVTCSTESTLDQAMDMMIHNSTGHRIRHLPIVSESGEFAGVISIGDVVEALLTKTAFENKLLKSYIQNWPDEE